MVLAVNVGNTHITFGFVDGKSIFEPVMSIKTDCNQTAFGYAAELKQTAAIGGFDFLNVEGVIISSVVPPLTQIIKSAVKILTGLDALVIGAGVKSGIHISTDDPGSVASDLVAMAVGAKEEYDLPCFIVDMGTAVTVTVVDESGRFIGGSFMPGIGVSLKALEAEAALLPQIDVLPPKKTIGSSTVECMRSGVVYGYAGAVDGIIDRFADELGKEPSTVVAASELSALICSYTKRNVVKDSRLLLKGLGLIYNKNKK